jgi:glycosidase
MKHKTLIIWLTVLAVLVGLFPQMARPALSQPVDRAPIDQPERTVPLAPAAPSNWCVAGGFQPGGGWNNGSDPLYDDGTHGDLVANDGVFSLDYVVAKAPGYYEWKFFACGTWDGYPGEEGANKWLYTTTNPQTVKFLLDTNVNADGYKPSTYLTNVADSFAALTNTWTAVGNWQSAIWNNNDPATLMTQIAPGRYAVTYTVAAAGTYMFKVSRTGSWDQQFGPDGRSVNSGNFTFTTTSPNQVVGFFLDAGNARIQAVPAGTPGTASWYLRGSMNGWGTSDPLYDDGTHGDLVAGDGVYSLAYPLASAGNYEWKIAKSDWSVGYPNNNAWLIVTAGQTVRFTLDTNTYNDGWWPQSNIASANDNIPTNWTAVGDWQSWNNSNSATALWNWSPGQYVVTYTIPVAGVYNYKVSRTGSWDQQYGAGGRSVDASTVNFQAYSANQTLSFHLNTGTGRVKVVSIRTTASHDNNIWWDDLGHNSRDSLFRTPGGAVVTGTPVTLRLRAASGDLTAAKVRVYNDRTNEQALLNMSLAADDGKYEWWEATVPASADPTVYWYRFIAIDGTATAYYDDDAARDGGWGKTFAETPDNSWQLTVYDPAFQSPDWIKNAVVYQIFPDRFRDGLTANNTPTGTFFYDEPGGTVFRSLQSNWNEVICDPRSSGPCQGTYSKNFYGGDLQGLRDKLDYLKELGVTAVYLNPTFESPSNHKYDTTDYSIIDDNFGDQQTFISLTQELDARGMHLILDGVFNHTSSDSIYFDRYGRYPQVGACESYTSTYRSWYYFKDVPAGSGACVGSAGTPLGATYESWFGYDSLPKLNSSNPDVRALIFTSGTQSIGPYWMQYADGWRLDVAGDVDPGVLNDPNNDYWEGFRAATRAVNPNTYIVGEEWGNAAAWTLGDEWDATMNYQFSSAVLSFWRDTPFEDNDHNSGSSAGILTPLTPAQVDARLHNLEERYAPPAFYSMMNLLGSHDTNRALFMLDENTSLISPTIYLNPNYDWSDAIQRLKGVAIMQLTLPGAPTIYYGDEVGLVGPVAYAGGKWEDDPYNRQPYPWLDESGTPFYTHLQTQNGQNVLRRHYQLLTSARNAHPALRTGSFDTLLIDNTSKTYVYGRKWISGTTDSDAAVVLVNRNTVTQTIAVNVAGYLGNGAVFTDVLNSGAVYTVTNQQITVADVPPMFGAVLVYHSGAIVPPAAPTNLTAAEGNAQVVLNWDTIAGADNYHIYRSLLSGGGYTRIVTGTTSTVYTDTHVTNGTWYYYVVTASDANGNESDLSNEAAALPHADIDWANLQWPDEITHTISITPTANIYGQVYISGTTSQPGATPGLLAQVGYGLTTEPPISWTNWVNTTFNGQSGDNDEFKAQLLPEAVGEYYYVYRYSTTNGRDWAYADRSGLISASSVVTPGLLHVISSGDVTPPAVPQNLRVTHWGTDHISLAWDAVADSDLYAYDLYRYSDQQLPGAAAQIGRVLAPATVYTDTGVVSGHTYTYTVKALDTSFNASAASNEAVGRAIPRQVELRFFVTVPEFTPAGDTVYIAGDNAAAFGASWNPGAMPITQLSATQWMYTVTIGEGTALLYKYTRGTWDVVENWGSLVGLANRQLTTNYGATGIMTITDTVYNWRDPIVMSHFPADGATQFNAAQPITVAFNRMLNTTFITEATFIVSNTTQGVAYPGTFSFSQDTSRPYITSTIVSFTPNAPLPGGDYTVFLNKSGYVDEGPMQQNYQWSFDVAGIDLVTPVNGEVFTATDNISLVVPIQITTTNFIIPADGHWHLWIDGTMVGMQYGYTTTQTLLVGPHVITAEMVNPAHQPLGPVATINVVVNKLRPYSTYLPLIRR